MNVKNDEDIYEDDCRAFRAKQADMEMRLMELHFPKAADFAVPRSNNET